MVRPYQRIYQEVPNYQATVKGVQTVMDTDALAMNGGITPPIVARQMTSVFLTLALSGQLIV
ncbi:hypothetical protein D1831_07960 [Lactiplantibacillus garii]|uniref:Uncharacterized protein n=1 Tax=Lactiplantibacillus garii TaxID=2306423 RepID=A0A3R8KEC5_9LACO|nr:hypothetical protein [Lactiplantibacillus garii]RRK10315.1 hypothetical protein D1831_07960 [Lactiplantibacillus garii]